MDVKRRLAGCGLYEFLGCRTVVGVALMRNKSEAPRCCGRALASKCSCTAWVVATRRRAGCPVGGGGRWQARGRAPTRRRGPWMGGDKVAGRRRGRRWPGRPGSGAGEHRTGVGQGGLAHKASHITGQDQDVAQDGGLGAVGQAVPGGRLRPRRCWLALRLSA